MLEIWKILQLILLSSVKFVLGPPLAYLDPRYNLSFVETVLYCVTGGMLGVVAFTFFSQGLSMAWHWLKHHTKKIFRKPAIFSEPVADVPGNIEVKYDYMTKDEKRKLFTRRNRRIVKIWKRYGLFGIAAITPIILSIPIGTLVANSLESDKKKILIYMLFSTFFWAVSITSMLEFFQVKDINQILSQFKF
jgi:hypothetical protein